MAVKDEELVDIVTSEEEVAPEEPSFELVVDDGSESEEPAVDPKELEAKLEALKAEKEALAEKADGNAQMTQAFSAFAEQLKNQTATQQSSPPAPSGPEQVNIDWAALEASVNADAFKNPFQATMKSVAPAFKQLENKVAYELEQLKKKNGLIDSKLALSSDPELSGIYNKYKDEVETEVQKGVNYVTAAKQVKAGHLDDIIAEKVAEALAKQQEEAAQTSNTRPPQFTNSGSMGSAANRSKATSKVRVTQGQLKQMQQKALEWAMNPNDPDDMEFVYEEFKKAGMLN